ncbi:hypothetical protein MTR67_030344 [Solanum verrucosum]|uniref:Uncharacterized protein n=1 Tax=Solanum verrucosum TaxID=315347 RepID=A0AAF0R5U7_SOLVR|nr:hypothetical protein MTR67_030344 [Solanum verrucosum]
MCVRSRRVESPPVELDAFSSAFQYHFIPCSMIKESRLRFEDLTQCSFSVVEYETCFCELSRHAITIVLVRQRESIVESGQTSQGSYGSGRGGHDSLSGTQCTYSTALARGSVPLTRDRGRDIFDVPRFEWMVVSGSYPNRVIFFIRAQRLVDKGCLSYLDFIRHISVGPFPMDSIPLVRKFLNVFAIDLPSVPLDRDIDFAIDLELGTKPIFIPPYHMAPVELKELKDQLHDLLSKGFIRPSVSP